MAGSEVIDFNTGREKVTVVDEYDVGPYKISILIVDGEFKYVVKEPLCDSLGERIFDEIVSKVVDVFPSLGIYKLDEVLSSVRKIAREVVSRYLTLSDEGVEKVVDNVAFKCLGLNSIAPFLLDDKVEEVYFDGNRRKAYLDHRDWGRCTTNIILSERDAERVLSRIRLESGAQLDENNPSLKTEIVTRDFHIRALATIRPLASEEFMLIFRRMRNSPYTLPELIFNGTISAKAAAYLLFAIMKRFNICVIGEPKTGKTTLINALDLLVPLSWRRVYIEDAIESLTLGEYNIYQAKIKVRPPEEGGEKEKSKEITQLLHRSPDWVYLGEIRTPEDSQAMFHALSSGLVGFQTCHGKSVEDVILRWVIHHGVPIVSLRSMDLIVEVRRYLTLYGGVKRRVTRIAEIRSEPSFFINLKTVFEDALINVFAWDPKEDMLKNATNLLDAPIIKKAEERYGIDREEALEEIETYEFILGKMAEKQVFNVKENITVMKYLNFLLGNGGKDKWENIKKEMVKIIEKIE